MLDIKQIRSEPEELQRRINTKNVTVDFSEILGLDEKRRTLIVEVESLKAERNTASREIAAAQKRGENAEGAMAETRRIAERIRELDLQLKELEETQQNLLMVIPNAPHASVPVGHSDKENRVEREWGSKKTQNFQVLDHIRLGESLGLFDFPRGTKISGSGFPLYTGLGARLERAIINFMLDLQSREHGYTEVMPPFVVNSASMTGTGQLPKMHDDMYHCERDDLWLIPTAEVPITNIHAGEILDAADLPVRYCGYSPCFRREAGSYGRDVRGFLRTHQFNKVELVKLTRPEESWEELEKLTANAETVLRKLDLHYRVLTLCTGDTSFASAKTYDLEVWSPGEQRYLECSSCSNFEDFQARRANIRFKEAGGKPRFVHTLNGSGLATSRLIVALLETWQREDGGLEIPPPLRPFMGVDSIEPRS
ncbi:MAG: serine--tRNA ligase [Candidatus Delongbacteria bacterium]|nr:serine--tRNA ligase [Candidatus Cloacimonadota bacterium]MCB9472203.1 serine--tRNA ligase [Candidatus Delongbacteria bacterium]